MGVKLVELVGAVDRNRQDSRESARGHQRPLAVQADFDSAPPFAQDVGVAHVCDSQLDLALRPRPPMRLPRNAQPSLRPHSAR